MTDQEIRGVIKKMETADRRVVQNAEYVGGRNPSILNKKPEQKPDNRIPVPLAKQTVDDMTGYAGRAGDRVVKYGLTSSSTEDDNDPFLDYIREMEKFNDETLETAELYEEACSQGVAYEIWWVSDKAPQGSGLLTAEYRIVPTNSVYVQWTDNIKPGIEWFMYLSGDKDRRIASVYYPLMMEQYISVNGSQYTLDEDGSTEYPYETPPICIFTPNREMEPIYEAGKPLIDAYDQVMSKSMNEVDRFNALIALLADKASEEFKEALNAGEITVIDQLGDAMQGRDDLPKYLQKDFSGINDLYKNTLDRLNDDFRKTVKIPDMSDENFGGQQTGIAMAYKLLSLEFMASKIDTYFNKGLLKRLGFYADVYNASSRSVNVNDYKATVTAKRNVPVDVKSIVEVAVNLQTLISKRSLLEYIPNQIVGDVEKELERLADEREESFASIPTMDSAGDE